MTERARRYAHEQRYGHEQGRSSHATTMLVGGCARTGGIGRWEEWQCAEIAHRHTD
jgi:hypothetical protein